jgi:hypothetical protein
MMTPMSESNPLRPVAELSSVLASLHDLTRRVEQVASEAQRQAGGARLAADLFSIEASLRTGQRRLDKVVTALER